MHEWACEDRGLVPKIVARHSKHVANDLGLLLALLLPCPDAIYVRHSNFHFFLSWNMSLCPFFATSVMKLPRTIRLIVLSLVHFVKEKKTVLKTRLFFCHVFFIHHHSYFFPLKQWKHLYIFCWTLALPLIINKNTRKRLEQLINKTSYPIQDWKNIWSQWNNFYEKIN
jgi:hypothetical protein